MKTQSLILVTAFAAATASQSFAQSAEETHRNHLRAEYIAARAQGTLTATGEAGDVPVVGRNQGQLSRSEVKRQLNQSGQISTGEGADIGRTLLAGSNRSRAEVHAEAHRAARSAPLPGGKV